MEKIKGKKNRRFVVTEFVKHVMSSLQNAKAAIGIMITASHNPKEDNGYKVFWSNGIFSFIN